MCFDYNDYEILYLIKEGSEAAYRFMFKKYEVYIRKLLIEYAIYGEKREDFLQEGRMVLFHCIEDYRPSLKVTFYSFFTLSLRRIYYRLISDNYYQESILCEPNTIAEESLSIIYRATYLLEDPEDIRIYEECILQNTSLKHYAEKYNISYHVLYYRYTSVLAKLRNKLDFK